MDKVNGRSFLPGHFLRMLVHEPKAVRQRLNALPPLEQQRILAFEAGWLYWIVLSWLGLLLIVSYLDLPVFYPDYFRQVIWLSWGDKPGTNFLLLLSNTVWLWLVWIIIGVAIQYFLSRSKSVIIGILFDQDPLLVWLFTLWGIPASFMPITSGAILLGLFFLAMIFLYGLFCANEQPFPNDKGSGPFGGSLIIVAFIVATAACWKAVKSALRLSFSWGEVLGLLFIGLWAWLINVLIISSLHDEVVKTKKRFDFWYFLYLSSFLICPFLVQIYLWTIDWDWAYAFQFFVIIVWVMLSWVTLYHRLWIWTDLSLKQMLGFSTPLEQLDRYQALSIAPILPAYTARKFVAYSPAHTLALAAYFWEEKDWKKTGLRLLQATQNQPTSLSPELNLKLRVLQKKWGLSPS